MFLQYWSGPTSPNQCGQNTEYGEADKLYKERLKRNFDQRHCVATLPEVPDASSVLVQFGKSKLPGDTIHQAVVRRNCHDLITVPSESTPAVPSIVTTQTCLIVQSLLGVLL